MFWEKLDLSERQVLQVFSQLLNPKMCARDEKQMETNGSEWKAEERQSEKAGVHAVRE